jgi:hypothetical protein
MFSGCRNCVIVPGVSDKTRMCSIINRFTPTSFSAQDQVVEISPKLSSGGKVIASDFSGGYHVLFAQVLKNPKSYYM